MIHAAIPHYKALRWLIPCLQCLRGHSVRSDVVYSVFTMESDEAERRRVRDEVGALATVYDFPRPGQIGGQPLPDVLKYGTRFYPEADITVTVDPDALVLAPGWDDRVCSLLKRHVAAGINPRSDTDTFRGVPEWNWMAFRTAFWRDRIGTFQWNRHDIGHLFADAAAQAGASVHLWPLVRHPFADKAAGVCGDELDPEFCIHAFYSSRRRDDVFPDAEKRWILDWEQESELVRWALNRFVSSGTTPLSVAR